MCSKRILLIEPFYGGSHKQLIDLIYQLFQNDAELHTMPAKKWHWRAITSPLYFKETIPKQHNFRILFTSSVLPLAELVALRQDLAKLYKIVYFHENQLVYPVQERKQRYFQHGYNDILTCVVADKVLFNSNFNKESFLTNIKSYLNIMPDYKPKNLEDQIRPKCEVLSFPINIPEDICYLSKDKQMNSSSCTSTELNKKLKLMDEKLHIVWPHRWEHDKDPETFFSVLYRLKREKEEFYVSVVGEVYSEKPQIFDEAKEHLKENILNWGYQECKEDYYKILMSADVVVSTANHEFFGVSMLEATLLKCYPLCPKRLVYPEIYPDQYLYNTPNQLFKKLRSLCKYPKAARNHEVKVDFSKYSWETMKRHYKEVISEAMH